jgi:hypothetical protein
MIHGKHGPIRARVGMPDKKPVGILMAINPSKGIGLAVMTLSM